MVSIRLFEQCGRDAKEPGRLPHRHASLHKPSGSGVSQCMWCNLAGYSRQRDGSFEANFDGSHGPTIPLHKIFLEVPEACPAAHMSQEPLRYWYWWLAFVGGAFPFGQAIKDAT